MSVSLVRLPQVQARIGLSRTAIYDRMDEKSPRFDPSFPKPVRLGAGKCPPIAFVSSEVDAWIESRIELSRQQQAA